MPTVDPHLPTAIVTGASRGFGRAIAAGLAATGAHVVGVARDAAALDEVQRELGASFTPVVADVTDADLAARLIAEHRPGLLVLNAGATPHAATIQHQTWETFSANWQVDVRHVFEFVRAALLAPLEPGSVVVSVSSGAARQGSPMSGGYAGAKATVRFISGYAAAESDRNSLGIRFVSVLPTADPGHRAGGDVRRRLRRPCPGRSRHVPRASRPTAQRRTGRRCDHRRRRTRHHAGGRVPAHRRRPHGARLSRPRIPAVVIPGGSTHSSPGRLHRLRVVRAGVRAPRRRRGSCSGTATRPRGRGAGPG